MPSIGNGDAVNHHLTLTRLDRCLEPMDSEALLRELRWPPSLATVQSDPSIDGYEATFHDAT